MLNLPYRTDFPIDEKAVVLDLGAYQGEWSIAMHDLYGCEVHAFEPVFKFYLEWIKPLGNLGIQTHRYGLWKETCSTKIVVNDNASSMFVGSGPRETCNMVEVGHWFDHNVIGNVDVMKINIEGAEYDLLEWMLEIGLVPRVDHYLIQFHSFMPDYEKRYSEIEDGLLLTHQLMERQPFVWEWWSRRR